MHNETAEQAEQPVDRRTFLNYVIGALVGFITAAVSVPLVGAFVLPTLRKTRPSLISAGSVTAFPIGQPTPATVTLTLRDGWIQRQEEKGVWVVRRGESDFAVYNGRCTHLGCAYAWQPARREFLCPCHAGRFSVDGQVMGGPPPRPLDALEWKMEQGNLLVEYRDFRLGIGEKEAI